MGVSTDAILVYGVPLEEGAIGDWNEGDPQSGPAWMVYMGNDEDGIEIVSHCSNDYPMHIIAITGSKKLAYRGHPCRLGDMSTEANHASDELLRAFLKKHGLKRAKYATPGWWLASMWS